VVSSSRRTRHSGCIVCQYDTLSNQNPTTLLHAELRLNSHFLLPAPCISVISLSTIFIADQRLPPLPYITIKPDHGPSTSSTIANNHIHKHTSTVACFLTESTVSPEKPCTPKQRNATTHFFIIAHLSAFPNVWSSFKNSNEAAVSLDPGSTLNLSCELVSGVTPVSSASSSPSARAGWAVSTTSVMAVSRSGLVVDAGIFGLCDGFVGGKANWGESVARRKEIWNVWDSGCLGKDFDTRLEYFDAFRQSEL
jgi:hypothetical protein